MDQPVIEQSVDLGDAVHHCAEIGPERCALLGVRKQRLDALLEPLGELWHLVPKPLGDLDLARPRAGNAMLVLEDVRDGELGAQARSIPTWRTKSALEEQSQGLLLVVSLNVDDRVRPR